MSATRPHLLIVNQYFDTVEATGQVLSELCEDLAESVDVTVVAARPREIVRRTTQPESVRVVWVRGSRWGKSSLLRRAFGYAAFLAAASVAALRERPHPHVVMTMTDPPVIGVLGLAVARLRGSRLVIICQDIHPDVGLLSDSFTNRLAVQVLRWSQRLQLTKADRLVAIGDAMRMRLIERGADPDRVRVIPNWVDTAAIVPIPRRNEWATRHGLADAFTALHAGNLGQLHGLEVVIGAAGRVPEAEFVFVGEGSRKEVLIERCAGVDNVRFLPFQPREQLPAMLASADVHLVSLVPGAAGLLEPSKVYGILAAGRPVIASVDAASEVARVVKAAGCGIVVRPGDPEALADAVRTVRGMNATERAEWGERARTYAESNCDRQQATAQHRDLILALARSPRSAVRRAHRR